MNEYRGVGASPGRVLGKALICPSDLENTPTRRAPPAPPHVEWQRIEAAHAQLLANLRLRATEHGAVGKREHAALDEAHTAILSDVSLMEMMHEAVHLEKRSAEAAVEATFGEFVALFSALDDPLFAARANDVRDLRAQMLALLVSTEQDAADPLATPPPDTILIMRDLLPSEVARLNPQRIAGIALAHGSPLAHAAILARSMGIPLVCHLGEAVLHVHDGAPCLLDGAHGSLTFAPDAELLPVDAASQTAGRALRPTGEITVLHQVQRTREGVPVPVQANVNTLDEADLVGRYGGDGIGLLRTEFLFARFGASPTIDEQSTCYAHILKTLAGAPCAIRAFDFGGEKQSPWLRTPPGDDAETRRGVRLLFAYPDLLRTQFRALLRAIRATRQDASLQAQVRFLVPMVALPEEMDKVRVLLDAVAAEEADAESAASVALAAMIEIPSSALMAKEIAARCAMLSIGSNDLAQFLFAGDRSQQDAAAYANALHPAMLRMIAHLGEVAAAANCPLSLCGELAGNPLATPLLLGLGVTELSAPPAAIPLVKAAVGRYTLEECRVLAAQALAATDTAAVLALIGDDQRATPGGEE